MQRFLIESKLSQRAPCLTFRALIYFIFIYIDCSIKIFPPNTPTRGTMRLQERRGAGAGCCADEEGQTDRTTGPLDA